MLSCSSWLFVEHSSFVQFDVFINIYIFFLLLLLLFSVFVYAIEHSYLLSLYFCVSYYGNFQSIKISYYLAPTKHKNLWLVYSTDTATAARTHRHTRPRTRTWTRRRTDRHMSCGASCCMRAALCLFVPVIFP